MTLGGTGYGEAAIGSTEEASDARFANNKLSATANLGRSSLSGTTTISSNTISYQFTPQLGDISGGTLIKNNGLAASFTTAQSSLTPLISPTPVTAEYEFGQSRFQVLGSLGEITVQIDDKKIETYTDIEIQKRLNEVDTFSLTVTGSTYRRITT